MNITEKEEKEVLERYGIMPNKKLACMLGINRYRLVNIAKQLGLWSAPLSLETLAEFIDPEELALKYKSHTKKECAAIYNVSEVVISYVLRVNSISKYDKKIVRAGIFNKPNGWNPIFNAVIKENDYDRTY